MTRRFLIDFFSLKELPQQLYDRDLDATKIRTMKLIVLEDGDALIEVELKGGEAINDK